MMESIPPEVLRKVRKLAQLPDEARQSRFGVSVTRLTVLKNLCSQPEVANRFVSFLAHNVLKRGQRRMGHTSRRKAANPVHREMMSEALAGMEAWATAPTEDLRRTLENLYHRMKSEQNESKTIPFGAVRLIADWKLFLCEQALACLLYPQDSSYWAYQMARDYAERYDASHGSGLTPASAPLLQDIADFWMREVGVTEEELATPIKKVQTKQTGGQKKACFTDR
jgi:hypothetical protein